MSREEVHGVACAADGRRPDDEWYPRSRLDVMHGPVQFVCVKDCGYLLTEPIGSTFLITGFRFCRLDAHRTAVFTDKA
jgi:hypothetical protein